MGRHAGACASARPAHRETILDRVLYSISFSVARRVIARWRDMDAPVLQRISRSDGTPRFWQKGGGFDRNTRDLAEFTKSVQYIHRNPVKRDLVECPEDWKWSSARWRAGGRTSLRPAARRQNRLEFVARLCVTTARHG
ncbi:MAG: hypothetical protein IT437_14460 [Phycisphaerales bacterium]|nr:hypothetical protein [Phycisphaerales bacterium]